MLANFGWAYRQFLMSILMTITFSRSFFSHICGGRIFLFLHVQKKFTANLQIPLKNKVWIEVGW